MIILYLQAFWEIKIIFLKVIISAYLKLNYNVNLTDIRKKTGE